ncbi:MAG: bifunctional folylpolyglutamate synthase/dihydrofolate synthase [Terracidiphilus sp.]|nr:bifunctional folylpolyglutamate synthase/dihydrofolate synthase [Terracidiphilus sp.]
MSYASAIDQLSAMTPELATTPGQPRRKFSLEQVRVLLEALGNPHLRFRSVLIAGTNGKGSTAATLASVLMASGLRTGLYTSPHLVRPNERIRIDATEISDDDFARLYFRVHDAGQQLVLDNKLDSIPSFFETLTAMAFLHFAESAIDVAVLEVGMGGRLDATNVVDPLVSVITDVSFDHTEWLGSTLTAIAREKAGILRPHGTLVTLPQHPEANQAIGEVAVSLEVRGISAVPYMPAFDPGASLARSNAKPQPRGSYTIEVLGAPVALASPLIGAHQHRNIALAVAAAVELAQHYALPITAASIAEGVRTTQWPARLERITTRSSKRENPTEWAQWEWVLDVAHNPAGAWALRAGLSQLFPEGTPLTLVFSCLRDKPLREMAQILFPLFDRIIFAPIHSPRATPVEDLLAAAEATGTPAVAASSVSEALALAQGSILSEKMGAPGLASETGERPRTNVEKAVVVSGSVYLVGEARAQLLKEAQPQ